MRQAETRHPLSCRHLHLALSTLLELDELVGDYLTKERPTVQWEDSYGMFRFDTESEARAAIRNPYYQLYLSSVDWSKATVVEVRTYQPYSTDLKAAWQIVERLSDAQHTMELRREQEKWVACFGTAKPVAASSAPLAICLAGLRVRGVEVGVDPDALF